MSRTLMPTFCARRAADHWRNVTLILPAPNCNIQSTCVVSRYSFALPTTTGYHNLSQARLLEHTSYERSKYEHAESGGEMNSSL